jgi:hypothetical protein
MLQHQTLRASKLQSKENYGSREFFKNPLNRLIIQWRDPCMVLWSYGNTLTMRLKDWEGYQSGVT